MAINFFFFINFIEQINPGGSVSHGRSRLVTSHNSRIADWHDSAYDSAVD